MWRDQPISQRNKTTERAVGVGIGGDREGGGVGQNLKRGSGGLGNIGGDLHKIVGGVRTPLPTMVWYFLLSDVSMI